MMAAAWSTGHVPSPAGGSVEQLPGVVLEQSPVGVAVFDPDGCCVRVNPALQRQTALTTAE